MRAARTLSSRRVAACVSRACVAVAVAAALLGCERKAPGPAECSAYARAFVRDPRDNALLAVELQSKIDAITQLCLTTPYDRELIACAQSTGRARACFDVYKRRVRQAP